MSGGSGIAHRIVRVVQNVQHYLLQLIGIADHFRQIFLQPLYRVNMVAGEIVGAQLQRFADDGVELHRLALRRHLAGKTQQVLHDQLGALRLLHDKVDVVARRLRNVRVFRQQIGKAQNGSERVVDFVSHARNQLADRCHLFRVTQLGLQIDRLGNVGHHRHHIAYGSILIAHGTEVDGELAHSSVAAHH